MAKNRSETVGRRKLRAEAKRKREAGEPLTQDECAVLLGVVRSRVAFVEARALRKIRALVDPSWAPSFG